MRREVGGAGSVGTEVQCKRSVRHMSRVANVELLRQNWDDGDLRLVALLLLRLARRGIGTGRGHADVYVVDEAEIGLCVHTH